MSETSTGRRAAVGTRARLALAVAAVLIAAIAGASASTLAWADALRDEGRMLPGTMVASIDVSDRSIDEAREAVDSALAEQLDGTITLTYGDLSWDTTPRELGVSADVDAAVAAAYAATDDAGFTDLVRMRWAGASGGFDQDVELVSDGDATAAFVDTIGDELDRDPRDAELSWGGDGFEVADDRAGRVLDRDAATVALATAIDDATTEVELPVSRIDVEVTTEAATQAATAASEALDAALDHEVEVVLGDSSRTVTPRELDANVDAEAVGAAALAGDVGDVELSLGDDALRAVIGDVASGQEVAAQDASLSVNGGSFDITPEQVGQGVDRGEAGEELRAALAGDGDRVELSLSETRPSVTASSFASVLVLDRSARELSLYRDGDVARSWPVAVGASSSPTPTGQFTIGAKRFEPTWVNPAPDRWGADMPERIGPGPDNPLGARALNWNDSAGRDTLIRFHGTPNEGSIGSATSNGCVRMFNADVAELYDLVSTGTVIVSHS